jgi:hypothetical protein
MKKKFNNGLNSIIMALTQVYYYGSKDKNGNQSQGQGGFVISLTSKAPPPVPSTHCQRPNPVMSYLLFLTVHRQGTSL